MTRAAFLTGLLSSVAAAQHLPPELRLENPQPVQWSLFGVGADLDRDWLAVGDSRGPGNQPDTGAVYLYRQVGDGWALADTVWAANGTNADRFGSRVLLRGDELFVGAPRPFQFGTGHAYVFERGAGGWTQVHTFGAGSSDSDYGTALAVDGDLLAVGDLGWNVNRGRVHLIEKGAGGWSSSGFLNPTPVSVQRFGESVSIAGDEILVGAPFDSAQAEYAGSVYLFERGSSGWSQTARLQPLQPLSWGRFGSSVLHRGDHLVVGQIGGDAHIYERTGPPAVNAGWELAQTLPATWSAVQFSTFGWQSDADGDTLVLSDTNQAPTGTAHVYRRESGAYVHREVLALGCPNDGFVFGRSLGISGSWVVVGGNNFVHLYSTPLARQTVCPGGVGSTGAEASLVAGGSPEADANRLRLHAVGLPPDQFGLPLVSAALGVSQPPGAQGLLCLDVTGLGRQPAYARPTGACGQFWIDLDTTALPTNPVQAILPGETWYFQVWYRDWNPGRASNFTNAFGVTFE